ncbi:unnamed protein product [Clonostachys rosea]|uniref:Uncharacterized protein n=1 Tax=Bionectria ochroleuca TaxID=29856 RepID=A0ABY6ULJ3_BIOOC|nr:unnamed protein product [Clonostachys rosea]
MAFLDRFHDKLSSCRNKQLSQGCALDIHAVLDFILASGFISHGFSDTKRGFNQQQCFYTERVFLK